MASEQPQTSFVPGCVQESVVVFQPSEENGDDAQAMVDDGLVDKAPELYADAAGRNAIADDVPVNHSSTLRPGAAADAGHGCVGAGSRGSGLAVDRRRRTIMSVAAAATSSASRDT